MSGRGWIGIDLDGTLARYDGWNGELHIGEPIPLMVTRVKRWLAEGRDVRIVTARVGIHPDEPDVNGYTYSQASIDGQHALIEQWCLLHLGQILPITCSKDFQMAELWDDRCVQVIPNTGLRVDGQP